MTPLAANGIVSSVALLLNIPFGIKRANCQKLSAAWFFWLHASIPLIILLRCLLKSSAWMIPANVLLAFIGQIFGAQIEKKYFAPARQQVDSNQ